MSQRYPRDLDALIRLAKRQKWRVSETKGKHIRFTSPSGAVYVSASSPSDWRGVRNLTSALRSMGLKPRGSR
jgi:hypothetical protein